MRMTAIGAYEAKTRLPELLRAVAGGDSFVITHRDRAVARLVPVSAETTDAPQAVRSLQQFMARRPAAAPASQLDALRREDLR